MQRPYYTSVEKLYLYLVQVLISENSKATNNIHHLLKHHEMYHKHARHVRPAIMGRYIYILPCNTRNIGVGYLENYGPTR